MTTLFLISMADDDDWDTDPAFENNMTEAERRRAGERAMWKAPPRGSGQLAPPARWRQWFQISPGCRA